MQTMDFYPMVISRYPQDQDHAPTLADPAAARLVPAVDIAVGDVILAVVDAMGCDYFNEEYTANPTDFDPKCECGVCCEVAEEDGPIVVLTADYRGSGCCDPMLAKTLFLAVPAAVT
ncbi:hypothetical protein ACFXKG_30880 [Streptomyces sp. NPDC059255]|uniref:hypothetical protein n=1 Tax=Streptomyces sp. NPDC059255 TaxID=3346793 RepID=UPI0036961F30